MRVRVYGSVRMGCAPSVRVADQGSEAEKMPYEDVYLQKESVPETESESSTYVRDPSRASPVSYLSRASSISEHPSEEESSRRPSIDSLFNNDDHEGEEGVSSGSRICVGSARPQGLRGLGTVATSNHLNTWITGTQW